METDDVDALKQRIAELEAKLFRAPQSIERLFNMTPHIALLFTVLIEEEVVTERQIAERVPGTSEAKVSIYRLRKALAPFNISIHSHRRVGWYIDDTQKQLVKEMIDSGHVYTLPEQASAELAEGGAS